MNILKKIVCIILTICLIVPMSIFAEGNFPFIDVSSSAWYRGSVQFVYDMGIMSGTSEDTFSPNMTTTRGMIVTILHRISGEPVAKGNSFTDVAPHAYYNEAISWASEAGIVKGYGGNLFGPDDPITREQMASILCRYTEYCGYDTGSAAELSRFRDRESVSSYAVESLEWAVAESLITGVGNDLIDPRGFATRAQVATIITRYFGLEFKLEFPEPDDDSLGFA